MGNIDTSYTTFTLENGLRVVHRHMDSPVVYCGYQIAAGTSHELSGEEGLAHFVEHVSFKGTHRRSSLQIINCLEGVGGELNAFTNKTSTVYYSSVLAEYFSRAVDLLSDIVFHSTYPQHEIDKEVEVICDEIESYNDSPSELIFDDFENVLFQGTPLGHNILGTSETVRSFTTESAKRFTEKYYRPDNMVFFVYGNIDPKKVSSLLEKHTPSQAARSNAPAAVPNFTFHTSHFTLFPSQFSSRKIEMERETHQSHVICGTLAPAINDASRWPLYLLNNILGGPAMNARLNLALRERNGLVYTVESSLVSYPQTGLWTVYFGCDKHDVNRCLRLVRRELDKLMSRPLTDRQLSAAKLQIKGQIALACENKENFALDFGKSFLQLGVPKDITTIYSEIDHLSPLDLQQTARQYFHPDRMLTLIYK